MRNPLRERERERERHFIHVGFNSVVVPWHGIAYIYIYVCVCLYVCV